MRRRNGARRKGGWGKVRGRVPAGGVALRGRAGRRRGLNPKRVWRRSGLSEAVPEQYREWGGHGPVPRDRREHEYDVCALKLCGLQNGKERVCVGRDALCLRGGPRH